MGQQRTCCCNRFAVRPHRLIAFLTGVQVLRALWEIWGCIDNEWPSLVNTWIMPTIYTSCLLSICMMTTSACATWSVYKNQVRSLNISWWIYYTFTVLAFFNSCAILSIICIAKDRFIIGCVADNGADVTSLSPCIQMWEESVAWAAVSSMFTLMINIAFAYMLYRIKSQYPYHSSTVNPETRSTTAADPPPYNTKSQTDEDGFQVIELK